jgi:hypothetical protein
MLTMLLLSLLLASPFSISASNLAPSVHPGFSAVLRSRSLERFEPQVFQDGQARISLRKSQSLCSLLSMYIYLLSLSLSLSLSLTPLSPSHYLSLARAGRAPLSLFPRRWTRFLCLLVDGHSSVTRLTDVRPRSVACEQGMPHIADLPSTGLDCVLRFY